MSCAYLSPKVAYDVRVRQLSHELYFGVQLLRLVDIPERQLLDSDQILKKFIKAAR